MFQRIGQRLYQETRYALCAMGYFTRVPVPGWVGWQTGDLDHAARYFPWVGLLIGALLAGVFWLAQLLWPVRVALVLCFIVGVLLTGAFHEDGLADAVDGFGGGYTRDDRLRIMHDSRIGSFGAIALLLAYALRLETLSALAVRDILLLMPICHAASRWLAASLLASLTYVRPEGRAKPVATQLGAPALLFAALPCLTLLALPAALVGCLLVIWLLERQLLIGYLRRRLGGYTGDTLGMAQQLTELTGYAVALAWITT